MQIQARISIKQESNDSSFVYTEDLQVLKQFNPNLDAVEPWHVKVGTPLTIEGTSYTIKSVLLEIYDDTEVSKYGVRMNSIGEPYPYNLKVVIVVN